MTLLMRATSEDKLLKWISDNCKYLGEDYSFYSEFRDIKNGVNVIFNYSENEYFSWEIEEKFILFTKVGKTKTTLLDKREIEELPRNIRIEYANETITTYINNKKINTLIENQKKTGRVGFFNKNYEDVNICNAYVCSDIMLIACEFYDEKCKVFKGGTIHDAKGLVLHKGEISLSQNFNYKNSPLFRKKIHIEKTVKNATVQIGALGFYEFYINGDKVDNRVLASANSEYSKRILYDEYNVGDKLKNDNVFAIWLGNGYDSNYSKYGYKYFGKKCFFFTLHIEYENGETQEYCSDELWKTANSAILYNDIYNGEYFNSNLYNEKWCTLDFDDFSWENAVQATVTTEKIEKNTMPSIKIIQEIKPTKIINHIEDKCFIDFGQNFSGFVRLFLKGEKNEKITIRYSENCKNDEIDPWSNVFAKACDTYICNGENEVYEPKFTYHGFRYVSITGAKCVSDIVGLVVSSELETIGNFECSNTVLNRINENAIWSFKSNLMSIPTDCCMRSERTPCMMDSAVGEETIIYNFHMKDYYKKWFDDIKNNLDNINPDWGGDIVSLGYNIYWYYNDTDFLKYAYPYMKNYIEKALLQMKDYIYYDGFGDWCAVNNGKWENYFRNKSEVNTCLMYHYVDIMDKLSGNYGEIKEKIKRAFHKKYFDGRGYGDNQTTNILALAFGLSPSKEVANYLVEIIRKTNHLDTGIYATKYLFSVLCEYGYSDLAIELICKDTYPSFGFQIKNGATTMWEQWHERCDMSSHNHYMFGGICTGFYQCLGGIYPLKAGFCEVLVKPCFPKSLNFAKCSIYGISVQWVREFEKINLCIKTDRPTQIVLPNLNEKLKSGTYKFTIGKENNTNYEKSF